MRATAITIAVLTLLAVGYVLSYAPVYRMRYSWLHNPSSETWNILYVPVQYLIDDTPLREPLLQWADVWGVRYPISEDSLFRQLDLTAN